MKYIKFDPMSRNDIEAAFASEDPTRAYTALMSAVYHDEDWRWVQNQCHRFLNSNDAQLRRGAIQGMGLVAVFRGQLDTDRAVAALTEILKEPQFRSEAEDALGDIRRCIPSARPS